MNIASDPKSLPKSTILSPEANQAAALANYTGVMTVDLDAIVANWRKLEKTGVPAECAAVVKANAYGCGAAEVSRALSNAGCKTFFVATLDEARVVRSAVPASAAARDSRRLRRLSRWRLTWRVNSSATRLIECRRSGEASLARNVTPLRYSVASATWPAALAGLRSVRQIRRAGPSGRPHKIR